MPRLKKWLVASCLTIVAMVVAFQCITSPESLARQVARAHEETVYAKFMYRNEQSLIGETDVDVIVRNTESVKALVLMTKDQLGFVAFKNDEMRPFRMFHFAGHMASEYYLGSSTKYVSSTSHGIEDTKFAAPEDCFLAPCFFSRFGISDSFDVELIKNGTRDFWEEARLFFSGEGNYFIVKHERVVDTGNPADNWKILDVFRIDPKSKLIVMKATSQIESNGKGIKRERSFAFINVSKKIPTEFGEKLADFKDAIRAFTVTYIDPDTLDANKAEEFAQAQLEYELAMQAKQAKEKAEQEKSAEQQPAKEGDAASQQPVQRGG